MLKHTSMKLWNCVNILNINIASVILPLQTQGAVYEVSLKREWEGTSRKKEVEKIKSCITRTGQSVHKGNGQ